MARPRDQLTARVEELLEVRGHLVERRAELHQLARPGLLRPRAQVAAGEALRRVAQPVERPQDLLAEQQRAGERAHGRDDHDQPERALVVHPEHDEPGADDDRNRQADRRHGQHCELRANAHARNR